MSGDEDSRGIERPGAMAARPVVLPEPFNGDSSWGQWECHFKNVAEVNNWEDGDKLKWLKVRLTGRAQTAFQRLPEAVRASFKEATAALRQRFEPPSKKPLYQAELQQRRKKKTESWADFADDLRAISEKAYPELEDKAKETLALNAYLSQLSDPQIAFGVKQKRPENLDDAVTATVELESYLPSKEGAVNSVAEENLETTMCGATVGAVSTTERLVSLVEKLTDRVKKLEQSRLSAGYPSSVEREPALGGRRYYSRKEVVCYRCGRKGHIARNCNQNTSKEQGN